MQRRSAFTLLEVLVVLVLMAITAAAALPAFTSATRDPIDAAVDDVVHLLTRARDSARERGMRAEVVFAPREGRYWLSAGGTVETGILTLAPSLRLVGADSNRVSCTFAATGAASPCALAIRGARDALVRVDAWSGAVTVSRTAHPR